MECDCRVEAPHGHTATQVRPSDYHKTNGNAKELIIARMELGDCGIQNHDAEREGVKQCGKSHLPQAVARSWLQVEGLTKLLNGKGDCKAANGHRATRVCPSNDPETYGKAIELIAVRMEPGGCAIQYHNAENEGVRQFGDSCLQHVVAFGWTQIEGLPKKTMQNTSPQMPATITIAE